MLVLLVKKLNYYKWYKYHTVLPLYIMTRPQLRDLNFPSNIIHRSEYVLRQACVTCMNSILECSEMCTLLLPV